MMEVTRKRELTMTSTLVQYRYSTVQYSTEQYIAVQYSTVQLPTFAAREESGSSVRRHSWVRSWAQHMPCRYIVWRLERHCVWCGPTLNWSSSSSVSTPWSTMGSSQEARCRV